MIPLLSSLWKNLIGGEQVGSAERFGLKGVILFSRV